MKKQAGEVKLAAGFFPVWRRLFFATAIVSGVAFLFLSCEKAYIYNRSQSLPESVWHQKNILRYTAVIEDTSSGFDFYVNVRNTTSYRFSNLYMFITVAFPGGHFTRDTIECILADNEGRWLGKGIGKLRDNSFLLKKGIRFEKKGIYTFTLEQAMRVAELEGIADAGISIRSQEK